jgi:hypothetical protein
MKDMVIDFFTNTPSLGIVDTLINLVIATIMACLVRQVYIRFGKTLSNRKHFANSFLLITVCITLIISLIQSSIALSLGLVGSLSIIRFRTAIKEPEELTYLFLCVAIGIGLGTNARLLTITCGLLIIGIIVLIGMIKKPSVDESYNLTVKTKKLDLDQVVDTCGKYSSRADLRRFDTNSQGLNVILFAEFKKYESLKNFVNNLKELDCNAEITFVSTKTMG